MDHEYRERAAFKTGSLESKAPEWNAGPSLTLCEREEALLLM